MGDGDRLFGAVEAQRDQNDRQTDAERGAEDQFDDVVNFVQSEFLLKRCKQQSGEIIGP